MNLLSVRPLCLTVTGVSVEGECLVNAPAGKTRGSPELASCRAQGAEKQKRAWAQGVVMRTQILVEDLRPTATCQQCRLFCSQGPNLLSVLASATVALVYGRLSIGEENQSVKTEKNTP